MTTTGTTPPPTPVPGEVKPERAAPRRRAAGAPGAGQGAATPVVRIVLLLLCLLWLIPTVGIVVTSFRTPDAALASGWWTAITSPLDFTQWTISNYTQAWDGGMGNAFINSFAVTLPATIIPIMIAAFAAYAFTFIEFPFRDTLFVIIVALLVVPNQVALVPLLRLYTDLNLTGQFAAVYLAHIGFGMPLAIYILRNYMSTLPKAVVESAKIDGASHFKTFWRLIVPMSVPALASFAIFQFLWTWNDLLVALLYLGPGEKEVVTVAVAGLVGQQNQGWQLLTAGAILSMLVPIAVFVSLQRYFVRGLTAGSVKG
jgi:alpha-glucoside transport system permease protein